MAGDPRDALFLPHGSRPRPASDPSLLERVGELVDVLANFGFGIERVRGTVVRAATSENPIAVIVPHGLLTRRVEVDARRAREVFAWDARGAVADRLAAVQAARWARRARR